MKTFKKLFLLFFLMSLSAGYALTDYCATARSSASPNASYTLNYTCRNVGGTTYEFKLEFPTAVTNVSNANIGANPGPVNIGANLAFSNANKTLSYQFNAGSTPSLYVATIFVIISGTEVRWDLPTDANFAATCGGGGNPLPVFGAWSIPAQTVGAADFTIVPPTTNSSGAITYTSGTTSVATIVNTNQIHIVGAGTSTITLNQAADATHSAGSTTATLTVNGAAPTTAAPLPPARNSWDVISLYSDAYTTLVGATYQHGVDVSIAGNTTRFISNLLLARLAFPPTNISAMTTMHIDVYSLTLDPTWFELQGIRVTRNTAVNGWVSLDIPLSSFTGLNASSVSFFDLNNPTGAQAPQDDMYVDNVYFYRPATTQPPTLGAFTVPAKNVGDADFLITPPTSNSSGAWSYTSSNTGVATIVSGNMIHIVSGGSSTITATQAANGTFGQGVATATFTVSFPPLTTPAPTPPARATGDVMSIYSNAYTQIPGTVNTNPNWGQATVVTTQTIGSDNLLKYTNLNYQGTDFGSSIDVSAMQYVHIDVYTQNETSLNFYLISTNTGERAVGLTPLTLNGWNSYDIPLSSYTSQSGFSVNSLFQFKMVGSGGKTIYVDNMYFWKPAAIFVNPTITFNDINKVVGDADFTVSASSNSPGAFTYGSSNTSVATIVGSTVHIVGAGTATITANQAASGLYNPGTATATLTVAFAPLTTAAPTPPARNDWDVISIYSNAYTPAVTPNWQQAAATTDEQLQGNDTKKMSNFLIELANFTAQDLTAMTTLHMDVYSEDCAALNVWLQNNGDKAVSRSITLGQWTSFDIPLSAYSAQGLNLNGVFLIKLESLSGPGRTIWVDNIYFYRPATTQPATLSNFSFATTAYNAPDFTITPPTSNSNGAFSYTSSNPAVATIVNGNMIHVVGGGVSTITATQAASGSFGPASITAQLTVTFPAPGPSPIPPARTPDRVFSMFTGTPSVYANSITAASAPWSGATMTEVPNGTNTALQSTNFGFLGLTDIAEVHFDVTSMSHLHLDIFLNEPLNANPALSRVNVFLLANGDYLFPVSNLTAGWNSISIPMTNFSAADLTTVWGLKLENINPATQIYIDNVYFSNECYTYYADVDQDGFGNPDVTQNVCDGSGAPSGYVANNTDCNDAQLQYADVDGDGFGSTTLVACGVTNHTDCNDNQLQYADLDGDGFGGGTLVACGVTNHDDCDDGTIRYADNDNDGFGSLVKVACGGVTNNTDCDDNLVRYADADNDGYGSLVKVACGGVTNSNDCDDTKNTVHPGAAEIGYNLIDDDCDGLIDEGFPPKSTTITGVQCSTTLAAIDNQLYADIVAGAQGYQWRITTMTGPNAGQVQLLNTALRVMKLTQLSTYAYATTYKVEVAVYYAGFLQPYTTSNCTVTTPAITTSLVNCGQTLMAMSDVIYANNVIAATGYRFRITEGANTTIIDRNLREFRMNLITEFPVKFNRVYNVEVAVKNTDGSYLPYGPVCTVTTPIFPTTSIQDSQCDAYAPPTTSTPIYALSYPGAIAYAFNLSGNNFGTTGVEVIRTTRTFKLSDFSGLIPGATYNVRVRLIFNSSDPAGNYGKTCSVTVPGALRMAKQPFNAVAYPNPFSDGFAINVTSSAHENVVVKIYDMTGRLLQNRNVTATELETLVLGENLPSGVYNAIVTQGEDVKTLRVIKR